MKAVVVECNKKDAVVLCNGEFIKIKNKDYSVGQKLSIRKSTTRWVKRASMAASIALIVVAGTSYGAYTWNSPYSYVSLDINPSIEYSLNQFDRVIEVTGKNEDGLHIADSINDSVKNTDLTTALTVTIDQLSHEEYIDSADTNYMVISVYSDDNNKASSLKSTVDSFSQTEAEVCSIDTVNVTKEVKDTADSLGITAGKMTLINEIAKNSTDTASIDPQELAGKSVKELEETIAASTATASTADSTTDTDVSALAPDTTSDSKSEDNSSDASSSKKDSPSAASSNKKDSSSDGNSSAPVAGSAPASDSGSTSKDSENVVSDGTDTGSSSNSSDATSSSKKNSGSSSSVGKKSDASSSNKKDADSSGDSTVTTDTVTEDGSQQTQSNYPAGSDTDTDEKNNNQALAVCNTGDFVL